MRTKTILTFFIPAFLILGALNQLAASGIYDPLERHCGFHPNEVVNPSGHPPEDWDGDFVDLMWGWNRNGRPSVMFSSDILESIINGEEGMPIEHFDSFCLRLDGDSLSQDIPIPYSAISMTLSAWVKCSDGSAGEGFPYLCAYIMDSSGAVLETLMTTPSCSIEWTSVEINSTLDSRAVNLRIFLKRSATRGCADNNIAQFDDITVLFDPSPIWYSK